MRPLSLAHDRGLLREVRHFVVLLPRRLLDRNLVSKELSVASQDRVRISDFFRELVAVKDLSL